MDFRLKQIGPPPSHRSYHLMAKAAAQIEVAEPSFRVLHHSLQYGHGKENDHFWSRPEDHGPSVRLFGRRGCCHVPLADHLPSWPSRMISWRARRRCYSSSACRCWVSRPFRWDGARRDQLATTGIFGVVRNPIYAAWIIFIIPGLVLLLRFWPMFFAPFLAYGLFKMLVGKEEKYLEERFGETYLEYKARVPEVFPWGHRRMK